MSKSAETTFPPYLIAYACLNCRKSFKRFYAANMLTMKCPQCAGAAHRTSRNFKAPKSSDIEQWRKISFLLSHGFRFNTIRENGKRVPYPIDLELAKEFVIRYRRFAEEPAEMPVRDEPSN